MADFKIQTAQNVSIQQNLAGIGQRILAYILDALFLFVSYVVIFMLLSWSGLVDRMGSWAFVSVLSLPYILYYPVLQYWNNGKTLGKQLAKIKVVKIDNSHPKLGDFLIRWIFRLFEVDIFGGIAIISILVSEKNQRLGDMVARTTVVSEVKKQKLSNSIFEDIDTTYQPVFPQAQNLSEKDAKLIKSVYLEAKRFNNRELLRKLSAKVEDLLEIERSKDMNYLTFIDTILKDYNYFAGRL